MTHPIKTKRCCGGSVWRDAAGREWEIIACRKAAENGARVAMYVATDDREVGGILWESEFRERFEWIRGTPA